MSDEPNVFISWSGERSRQMATMLRDWLRPVVQSARPWMSDTDIAKGQRGLEQIVKALAGIRVGIVCVTPENRAAPWLLFEAGALLKAATDEKNHVCTLLVGGMATTDVEQPLGMFQATLPNGDDVRKLVHTINRAVSDKPIDEKSLDVAFNALWPKLETEITRINAQEPPSTVDRSVEDMVREILETVRALSEPKITASAFTTPGYIFPDSNEALLGRISPSSLYGDALSGLGPSTREELRRSVAEMLARESKNAKDEK